MLGFSWGRYRARDFILLEFEFEFEFDLEESELELSNLMELINSSNCDVARSKYVCDGMVGKGLCAVSSIEGGGGGGGGGMEL